MRRDSSGERWEWFTSHACIGCQCSITWRQNGIFSGDVRNENPQFIKSKHDKNKTSFFVSFALKWRREGKSFSRLNISQQRLLSRKDFLFRPFDVPCFRCEKGVYPRIANFFLNGSILLYNCSVSFCATCLSRPFTSSHRSRFSALMMMGTTAGKSMLELHIRLTSTASPLLWNVFAPKILYCPKTNGGA